ncbi:FAD-dependent oxidoreductase [Actinoplanes cyaneus]|uniref:FAD-dependent oxidoreductase n=1 Tax=Actinoplanes cyaneus TaxID=52696 RepID=A0A919IND5_9ACTN|nr:FAD-binding oxidoreductase [Actinoplanes cyaneus]MCW2142238.1 sarcosine oxidase subunit beta [Actinoplanes cyaneus]GID69255.1 FAD-dependent oxidoreductase [Actinoplanes cyaneus]
MAFPGSAEVVVIGGGAIGVSIAFHLAEAGVRDVVLLERGELGGGSTCKAAGGVRAQFSDRINIELGARSLRAFADFGKRPGQEIDLHRVGYLFLLSTPEDVTSFERDVRLQNSLGVTSRMIDVAEAKRLSPLIETGGLLAAAWSPDDGHCTPESVVLGYARGARRHGATLLTGVTVTDLDLASGVVRTDRGDLARGAAPTGRGDIRAGRVSRGGVRRGGVVRTDRGDIHAGAVVCAAGAWSAAIGDAAGVPLPVTPLRRQIVLTEPMPSLSGVVPFTIDFASTFYFHREGPGLLMGMSDPAQEPGFHSNYSEEWLPRLAAAVGVRAPRLTDVGLRKGWAGLYEVTPDHNALIGGHDNFLYATGFSGHGFLQAPAVGEVIRDLYLGRAPVVDVGPLTASRFLAGAGARPESHIV